MLKRNFFILSFVLIFANFLCEFSYAKEKYTKLSDFDGKIVAVPTGSIYAQYINKNFPNSKIVYIDMAADIVNALLSGKVDASAIDEPLAIEMEAQNSSITYFPEYFMTVDNAFMVAKKDKYSQLLNELNEFIIKIKSDGTVNELIRLWTSKDESAKNILPFENLPATKGIIKIAHNGDSVPFDYIKDNRNAGVEIDIITRFCQAYGYKPEFVMMNFDAIIPSLTSNKCAIGVGCITITEERKQSVLFSEPVYTVGSVFQYAKEINTDKLDFNGKKIGVQLGTTCAELVPEKFPLSEISYFQSIPDGLTALKTKKIDAMCCALPSAVYAVNENTNFEIVEPYLKESYLYSIFASSDRGLKLCEEYSDFLKTLWDNGTIDEIANKWLGADETKKTIDDYSKLPAINGTLKMAVDTSIVPFAYVRDNKIVGHAIDLAVRFCKAKGYALEISDMPLPAVIASVKTGKSDFTQAMNKTKERGENTIFATSPSLKSGNVLVTVKSEKPEPVAIHNESQNQINLFFDELKASFNRTFIRENRWQLFIKGIINTMIITVLSILFGMILGFTVFMLCRTGNIFANVMTKFSVWLIKGTPSVVLLMILYYVVFGSVNISGIIVAIIAFTLTFGTSVYRMLTFGTGALDKGQTEAAYSLGYTDLQTFFTIILPQAALHFMPSFREEVTTLIKSTAVVGYIAVQDLTKMGDIVRSRTYEAFFPLIAVAIIYFILAGLLNVIVLRIHWKITPSKRKTEDILYGIDLKGDKNHD